jgi:hypothetical protein
VSELTVVWHGSLWREIPPDVVPVEDATALPIVRQAPLGAFLGDERRRILEVLSDQWISLVAVMVKSGVKRDRAGNHLRALAEAGWIERLAEADRHGGTQRMLYRLKHRA